MTPNRKRFFNKVRKTDSCWNWTATKNNDGYGRFKLAGKMVSAHRVSYIYAYGKDIPKGMCVLHKCNNRKCVNPEHLYVGTQKDNMRDRTKSGNANINKGELNGMAKLNKFEVRKIKEMLSMNVKVKNLAKMFSVTISTISAIKHNRIWRNI